VAERTQRTAEDVQREIEQARASLAATVDQLAARASPKRLVADAKRSLVARARTTQGKAIIGGAAAVTVLLLVKRVRTVRRRSAA
jgi:Protein of unknown function (DUF3618)